VNQQTSGEEQTIKYWDWSAKAYRFFGHTDFGQSGGTVGGNETTGPKTISFPADATSTESINDAPYFSTLWFSTGNPSYYSDRQFGKPVKLVFTKPFVKVRFMFISADPDNAPLDQMVLNEISFKPKNGDVLETKGIVTVSYPLTGTEIRESFSVSGVTESLPALTEYDVWHTLLPAMNQGVYTLSVTVNGDERHVSLPAEYMDWLPGYEYTYVFKLFEEGGVAFGQVYTAFTDWQTGTEKDYTIYNW
jgi:hypothetical protein